MGLARRINNYRINKKFLLVIIVSITAVFILIAVNALGIRMIMGVVGWVQGQSIWSTNYYKSVIFLERYAESGEESDFQKYREGAELTGDEAVWIYEILKKDYDREMAREYYLKAQNREDVFGIGIALIRSFYWLPQVGGIIEVFRNVDASRAEIDMVAEDIRILFEGGGHPAEELSGLRDRIISIHERTYPQAVLYLVKLGDLSRLVEKLLLVFSFLISLVVSLVWLYVYRMITGDVVSKMNKLNEGAASISRGDRSHRIVIKAEDEFSELADAFNEMVDSVNRSYSGLKDSRDKLAAAQEELKKNLADSQKFNKLLTNRELKMIELKKEIARLKGTAPAGAAADGPPSAGGSFG